MEISKRKMMVNSSNILCGWRTDLKSWSGVNVWWTSFVFLILFSPLSYVSAIGKYLNIFSLKLVSILQYKQVFSISRFIKGRQNCVLKRVLNKDIFIYYLINALI